MEPTQRAGRLVGGLSEVWFGYYGYVDWSELLDWHR
jgi:hypothetical protein